MERYNVMIERGGNATSQYPFSLPSGVMPLIIKLFSWKSSLFLNYLGRWSGDGIFRRRPKLLKKKNEWRGGWEGGKATLIGKKRCESDTNCKNGQVCVPRVWRRKANKGFQTLQLGIDEEIIFPLQRRDPLLDSRNDGVFI